MPAYKESPQNPTTVFPAEIISRILRYIENKDLRGALLVSHKWHECVMTLSDYLRDPVLKDPVSLSGLQQLLRVCQANHICRIENLALGEIPPEKLCGLLEAFSADKIDICTLRLRVHGSITDSQFHLSNGLASIQSLSLTFQVRNETDLENLFSALTGLRSVYMGLHFGFARHRGTISLRNLDRLELEFLDNTEWLTHTPGLHEFFMNSSFVNIRQLAINGFHIGDKPLQHIIETAQPIHLRLRMARLYMLVSSLEEVCKSAHVKLTSLYLEGADFSRSSPLKDNGAFSRLQILTLCLRHFSRECTLSLLRCTRGGLKRLCLLLGEQSAQNPEFSLVEILEQCPDLELLLLYTERKPSDQFYSNLGAALSSHCPPHLKSLWLGDVTDADVRSVFKPTYQPHAFEFHTKTPLHRETVTYLCDHQYCCWICQDKDFRPRFV